MTTTTATSTTTPATITDQLDGMTDDELEEGLRALFDAPPSPSEYERKGGDDDVQGASGELTLTPPESCGDGEAPDYLEVEIDGMKVLTSDETGATNNTSSVDDGWDDSGFGPNDKDPITEVTPLNLSDDGDEPLPYDAAEWPDHSHDGHIVDAATSPSDNGQLSCTD